MTLEELRALCLAFPGATEDVKWEQDLCFLVGEKMFLVTGLDQNPTGASFKVTPDQFEALAEDDRFTPAPYLARYKWLAVLDIEQLSQEEWETFARQSYQLVREKLPKRVQKALEVL